jgi:hypothetical protein
VTENEEEKKDEKKEEKPKSKEKRALAERVFSMAGRAGFEYHLPSGGPRPKEKRALAERVFSMAGRAGERPSVPRSSFYHPVPVSVMAYWSLIIG